MAEPLPSPRREGDGRIVLPAGVDATAGVRAQFVEPLRVVALRAIGDGIDSLRDALSAHKLALAEPGRFAGDDPAVLWRSPTEWLLVATSDPVADDVLRALTPGRHRAACAIDQSAGVATVALEGEAIDALLSRLIDANAIPREAGHGTRARLGDIAVTIVRRAQDRAWLVADRSVEGYLTDWIAYAAANVRDA
jgi:heterotetrameric sarcosine oxidase gamma subunit